MFAKILGITMGCIRCGGILDMTSLSGSLFPGDRGLIAGVWKLIMLPSKGTVVAPCSGVHG